MPRIPSTHILSAATCLQEAWWKGNIEAPIVSFDQHEKAFQNLASGRCLVQQKRNPKTIVTLWHWNWNSFVKNSRTKTAGSLPAYEGSHVQLQQKHVVCIFSEPDARSVWRGLEKISTTFLWLNSWGLDFSSRRLDQAHLCWQLQPFAHMSLRLHPQQPTFRWRAMENPGWGPLKKLQECWYQQLGGNQVIPLLWIMYVIKQKSVHGPHSTSDSWQPLPPLHLFNWTELT